MGKDEIIHLLLSLASGLFIGYFFHDYSYVYLAIISGFLIDTDHLIDYFLYKRSFKFSLREFLTGYFFDYSAKVYVFFHGFEYAFVFILLGFFFKSPVFYTLGLSLFLHLLFDTISNKPVWPTYFILFRLFYKFDHQKFGFPTCLKK